VAGYRKKREQQIKREVSHEIAVKRIEAFGKKMSGHGRTILIALAAVAVLGTATYFVYRHFSRKADQARAALGEAIKIQDAKVTATPTAGSTELTFATEKERAEKALVAFQDVANRFGEPYHTNALYYIALDHLVTERPKGIAELTALTTNKDATVSTLSKFALAQAKEADGDLDGSAAIYVELVKLGSNVVTPDTANVALANIYDKQGKKKDAADILFNIANTARLAKDADGKPKTPTAAARAAIDKLQKVDPDRYATLPPEPPPPGPMGGGGLPIG
jgi:hypothetical protein